MKKIILFVTMMIFGMQADNQASSMESEYQETRSFELLNNPATLQVIAAMKPRELMPLFFTCKDLHKYWNNQSIWPVLGRENLDGLTNDMVNESAFVRRALIILNHHFQILQGITFKFCNPWDEEHYNMMTQNIYKHYGPILKEYWKSDPYCFVLNIPMNFEDLLKKMIIVKDTELRLQVFFSNKIMLSSIACEKMWFGELALWRLIYPGISIKKKELNIYTQYYTETPYFKGVSKLHLKEYYKECNKNYIDASLSDSSIDCWKSSNSLSDSQSEEDQVELPKIPWQILSHRIESLCLNKIYADRNPYIGLFYSIFSKYRIYIIGKKEGFDYLFYEPITTDEVDRNYSSRLDFDSERKKWIQNAITAGVPNAWENYSKMIRSEREEYIIGIEKPAI